MRSTRIAAVFTLATACLGFALVSCSSGTVARVAVTQGSPQLGEKSIVHYNCGRCHTIPGVKGADGLVGPPLIHFSKRSFVAGKLANTPDNLARWIHGEPEWVRATGRVDGIDLTVSMTLGFPTGARAFLLASFDTPEIQELRAGDLRLERPFGEPADPPYRRMVEEFSAAALAGLPAPLTLQDSIANLRVVDGVRRSLDTGGRHDLAEPGQGAAPVGQ